MNERDVMPPDADAEARQRRLELARKAYKDFHALCFWSYRPDAEILEDDIPWVVRGLRHNGGHKGYRIVTDLCP
jgi:hypothetical protein